jgi:ubiquinone/menaquinone biosynthesis C-methylase UbiE
VGSGTGRHSLFFSKEGYRCSAIDFSPKGAEELDLVAREASLDIDVKIASADKIPYPDETFDGVLAYGVLYYLDPTGFRNAVYEIQRVLKPGGKAFVTIKSNKDSRGYFANKINSSQRLLLNPGRPNTWEAEIGMTLTLLDRQKVKLYFSEFKKLDIERVTATHFNGELKDDDWMIYVEK